MSMNKSRLSELNRPNLLIRAARHRMMEFNRDKTLRRVMPGTTIPQPGHAFDTLFELECSMNEARSDGSAAYSPVRHVDLLAALIHEAQIAELRTAA